MKPDTVLSITAGWELGTLLGHLLFNSSYSGYAAATIAGLVPALVVWLAEVYHRVTPGAYVR